MNPKRLKVTYAATKITVLTKSREPPSNNGSCPFLKSLVNLSAAAYNYSVKG